MHSPSGAKQRLNSSVTCMDELNRRDKERVAGICMPKTYNKPHSQCTLHNAPSAIRNQPQRAVKAGERAGERGWPKVEQKRGSAI